MQSEQAILRTDIAGMPLEWIDYQHAVKLLTLGQVSYSLGARIYSIRGGINRASGCRSQVDVNAIVATIGVRDRRKQHRPGYHPPLSNPALFKRDAHLCLYCGQTFDAEFLSRDHVRPASAGGSNCWSNLVTACKRCNNLKAGRTPEQAGMQLLAIPYVPTYAEYVYLQGKRILADQMDFLLSHFPRNSPLRQRLQSERDRV